MLRRLSAYLHLYLGLAALLVLIPVGLTGSVLVFHDAIEAAEHPAWVRTTPAKERAPLEAVVAAVDAAFAGAAIRRIDLPEEPEGTIEVSLGGDGRTVYVDPYRAAVLGSHRPGETLASMLFELHVTLLAGDTGKKVVGVTGFVLLALGVTGLVLWWRGRRHVRRSLTVRLGVSAFRTNYDLHSVLGALLVVPLSVVAFTGSGLIFYAAFDAAAHTLSGTPPTAAPPTSTPPGAGPPPTLDVLAARAQAAFPEARLARIEFPRSPEAAYRIRLRLPGELHPIGLTMVYLDRYSGAVLRAESALAVPAARRFGYLFYPLHIGSFGGVGVQILYVLLGLAPAVLAVTGALIWYLRRRKRRRRAGRAVAEAPVIRAERLPARPEMPVHR